MSGDLIEELWEQFQIETEEHLELIEPLLVQAETGELGDGISQLFRSMHSLKGVAKAMDLLAMEAVAHKSEDILGLVRDEGKSLSRDQVGLMLEAFDALRELRAWAVEHRADGVSPTELLDRLARTYNQLKGDEEPPATENNIKTTSVPLTPATPLHEPEMMEYFAELCREQHPLIGKLLEDNGLATRRKEICGALDAMSMAAGGMGFENMASVLDEMQALISAEPVELNSLLELVGEYHGMLKVITSSGCSDIGIEYFDTSHSSNEQKHLCEFIDDLHAQYNQLQLALDNSDSSLMAQLTQQIQEDCRQINLHRQRQDGDSPLGLMLIVEDLFGRVVDDELHLSTELISAVGQALSIVQQILVDDEAVSADNVYLAEKDLLESIRQERFAEAGSSSQIEELLDDLGINPEFQASLTPEQLTLIHQAISGGDHVYLVFADLEADVELFSRFIDFLEQKATQISSRTLLHDDKSCFEFLLASSLEQEEFRKALGAISSDRSLLRLTWDDVERIEKPVADNADKAAAAAGSTKQTATIRVDSAILDQFMNQIGELVLTEGMLSYHIGHESAKDALFGLSTLCNELSSDASLSKERAENFRRHLDTLSSHWSQAIQANHRISSTLERVQEGALALRVVPIGSIFNRLPRVVRDISAAQGKQVHLELEGKEVRIDKGIVETLVDPLIHMVRNSVDHGIESLEERQQAGKTDEASIVVKALQRGDNVEILIIDDGKGIDSARVLEKAVQREVLSSEDAAAMSHEQALQLVFLPGLSTAEKVTETSGRGVGMDVVKSAIIKLGGEVVASSEPGKGTTMRIKLPLSAAIQTALLVGIGKQTVAIPDRVVAEVIEAKYSDLQQVKGRSAILLRNQFLPIVHLADALGYTRAGRTDDKMNIIVLSNETGRIGVQVDRLFRRQELFLKDIHPQISAVPGVGGVSIMGDGSVVLVLDAEEVFDLAARTGARLMHATGMADEESTRPVLAAAV